MKLESNRFLFLLKWLFLLTFFFFINTKSYSKENIMEVDDEYLITETPLIIHDCHGGKYSVLPAGIALYPVINDTDAGNKYIIYINYQPQSGDLKSSPKNYHCIINELHLYKPSVDFLIKGNKNITKDDLVYLLQKSTLTKEDFAEVISKIED